jgi:hypothetical protein
MIWFERRRRKIHLFVLSKYIIPKVYLSMLTTGHACISNMLASLDCHGVSFIIRYLLSVIEVPFPYIYYMHSPLFRYRFRQFLCS